MVVDGDPAVFYRGRGARLQRHERHLGPDGLGEAAIVCIYFFCAVLYLRPYKKAAKRMARELLEKVNKVSIKK